MEPWEIQSKWEEIQAKVKEANEAGLRVSETFRDGGKFRSYQVEGDLKHFRI